MRKSLFTALVVAAGVASQAGAAWPPAYHITDTSVSPTLKIPTTKLGYLSISLNNQFQLYTNYWAGTTLYYGVNINPSRSAFPSRTWDINSYSYLYNCMGTVKYASLTKQINNQSIITAINNAFTTRNPVSGAAAGLFNTAGSGYNGSFNPATAMLVVVNYDNLQQAPPYPPTEDIYSPTPNPLGNIWNAPYNLQNAPVALANNGMPLQLNWPNQNYIAWGKPSQLVSTGVTESRVAGSAAWLGARVFVLDPANPNLNLRCFDVTPFFALEESFCWFCWDTMDRVTDGTITRGTTVQNAPDLPCNGYTPPTVTCGISGSGTTMFYWTVKFNNVTKIATRNGNTLLDWFYKGPTAFATAFAPDGTTPVDPAGLYAYGATLDDSTAATSLAALAFTVSGIAVHTWQIQTLSDGRSWSMGSMNMWAYGHGYSPMCGVFSGTAGIMEYDKTASGFGGAWCLTP